MQNDTATVQRRQVRGFTIDGVFSRDLDDALYLTENPDGTFTVDVSIADVASMIPKDCELDIAAKKKCFTRYHATYNSPMFPREFSEDKASLWNGKLRNTITVTLKYSPTGELLGEPTIEKTILISKTKFSYEKVDYIIRQGQADYKIKLTAMYKLARLLLDLRRANGALAIYDIMNDWVTDEEGNLRKLERDTHMAQIIVQEFMIATNCAVAEFLLKHDAVALYRNHTAKQAAPNQKDMIKTLEAELATGEIKRLLNVQKRLGLVMNRATYGPKLDGHYGLNVPAYLHFTSPIRRYPDLVIQRIVSAVLDGTDIPYSTAELEEIAAHVNTVQKDMVDRRRASFKQLHIELASISLDQKDFSTLPAGLFRAVLDKAINENKLSSELIAEISQRLTAGDLRTRELVLLLFHNRQAEPWVALKASVMEWLKSHADQAKPVLHLLEETSRCGHVNVVSKQVGVQDEPMHSFTFSTFVNGTKYSSGEVRDKVKYAAFQGAAVALIQQLVNLSFTHPIIVMPSVVQSTEEVTENWKGKLYEVAAKRSWAKPDFVTACVTEGPPQIFSCICTIVIDGATHISQPATTGTKKSAEQLAAKDILEQIAHKVVPENKVSVQEINKNYIGLLMELCTARKIGFPEFTSQRTGADHTPLFWVSCTVKLGDQVISGDGNASSKQGAKTEAAKKVYDQLIAIQPTS